MSELCMRGDKHVGMTDARVYVQTVASNEALLTKSEVQEAKQASQLIKELGYPSLRGTIELVSRSAIANCSVTPQALVRISDFGFGFRWMKLLSTLSIAPNIKLCIFGTSQTNPYIAWRMLFKSFLVLLIALSAVNALLLARAVVRNRAVKFTTLKMGVIDVEPEPEDIPQQGTQRVPDALDPIRAKIAADPSYDPTKDPEAMRVLEGIIPDHYREFYNAAERLRASLKAATSGVAAVEKLDENAAQWLSTNDKELISTPTSAWFKQGKPAAKVNKTEKESLKQKLKNKFPEVPFK
jgi:hypothetical protein